MASCEMCGKSVNILYKTDVEGTFLDLCEHCKKFGKVKNEIVIKTTKELSKEKRQKEKSNANLDDNPIVEVVREDYAQLIKKKREQMGWTPKELAMKLNERESTIHHIEQGKIEPMDELTKKIEKLFDIKLMKLAPQAVLTSKDNESSVLTIGDLIKRE